MFRAFKTAWIPLLLVVVVALGTYAIVHIRGTVAGHESLVALEGNSGTTKPFNTKQVTYEITGSRGSANLDYLDESGQPHGVDAAALPWTVTIVTTLSMSANIIAQGDRGLTGLRCRVIVDGEVRDDRSTDEYRPFIYCLVKAV
jgi:hypothetical protein